MESESGGAAAGYGKTCNGRLLRMRPGIRSVDAPANGSGALGASGMARDHD